MRRQPGLCDECGVPSDQIQQVRVKARNRPPFAIDRFCGEVAAHVHIEGHGAIALSPEQLVGNLFLLAVYD